MSMHCFVALCCAGCGEARASLRAIVPRSEARTNYAAGFNEGVTRCPAGEAPVGIEPTNRGFEDLCLTTWLRRQGFKSHQKGLFHQVCGASQHALIVR